MATVTINELSTALQEITIKPVAKKVLEGILNDFMDLAYEKESTYTKGKRVVPVGCTIEEVDEAKNDDATEKKFKDILERISQKFKSGDLTPQKNEGVWSTNMTPVIVVVTSNP